MSGMGRRHPVSIDEFFSGCGAVLLAMGCLIAATIGGGYLLYFVMGWDPSPPRPLTDKEFVECLRHHDREYCSKQVVDP